MALFEITEKQLLDRIKFENSWWTAGSIEAFYDKMDRRPYFKEFYPLVEETDVRRAVVLMGPRRVGKTVLLYHAIQALIDQGIEPQKIFYLSVETPIFNGIPIETLFQHCKKAVGREAEEGGFYVFFDEVQYLKDWEIHLKSLVDTQHEVKFIVSGSAAAALKLKSTESGAGRFTDFTLPPLTFHEYIHLKKLDHLIKPTKKKWKNSHHSFYETIDIEQLNGHFTDYMNFGGYPEVSLSEKIQSDPKRYMKSDIIDKVLLRDLPILYGIADVQELNSLFTTIAFNTGNEFTYENLSTTSGVSKVTIKKYLGYLEAAFLIRIVYRIDLAGKKFARATFFKIYLTNPSLRSALFSPIQPISEVMGNMVETAVFSQWFHRHWFTPFYSRWKGGEVDIVGLSADQLKPAWAVEVKWSNKFFHKPDQLKSLRKFMHANGLQNAIVTTIDQTGVVEWDGLFFDFIPAALYCYNIGRRTLE